MTGTTESERVATAVKLVTAVGIAGLLTGYALGVLGVGGPAATAFVVGGAIASLIGTALMVLA